MLALAGHKLDGPKGVGALYLQKGTHILAQQQGGTQERFRRAGTEDVAGAVGMGVAFELAVAERDATVKRVRKLRDRLRAALLAEDGVELTGHPRERLPNLLSVVVGEADGASIVVKLDLAGHRRLGRLGMHDRLDRAVARADRDGLPGRRGARLAAPLARSDDDRRRDRRRGRGRAADRRRLARRARRSSRPTRSARRSP